MGTLYVVGTPIGNLGDITFRALEVLKSVDIIACEDTRQTLKLLNHYKIKNKLISYHKFNEKEKSGKIIKVLLEGKNIAIVTDAGTPCISDPGFILMREAHLNKIDVIAVPGACAAISALSISGIDTNFFSFIGFLSTDNSKFKEEIDIMKKSFIKTFVIYESPKRIVKLFEKLKDFFPKSLVYVASDLTKIHERGMYGYIEDIYKELLLDKNVEKGEYVIILEKNISSEEKNEEENSIESLLVNIMVKEKCGMKEAIQILNKRSDKIRKNDIYQSSLNLKNMFEK